MPTQHQISHVDLSRWPPRRPCSYQLDRRAPLKGSSRGVRGAREGCRLVKLDQTPPDPLLTLPPPPPRPPSSTDAERQPLSLAVETDADDSSLLLPPPAVDQTPTTSRLPLSRPTPTTARLPLSRLKVGPKKILDLMNIPGLTRENVASHLQPWQRANGSSQQTDEHDVANWLCGFA
ncbi:uncharacterized protein A4U43_C09F4780 [Asparagus officinalis]|uniref:HTH myb-type domain-containing protein n=1 Tax=Asparagus officinalis TaxID=4686 RepID=A0A5P1E8M6_ASPOF|nr:uncharacterized protein A4U43_C09F4780 [Asparagus officinalis]